MTDHLKKILITFFVSAFSFIIFIYSVIFGIIPESAKSLIVAGRAGFTVYAVIAVMACSGCIVFFDFNNFIKILLAGLFLLYFFLLIIIDIPAAWLVLIFSALVGSYFKYISREKSIQKITDGDEVKKENNASISGIYLFIILFSFIFIFINNGFLGSFGDKDRVDWFNDKNIEYTRVNLKLFDNLKILGSSFADNWFLGTGQAGFLFGFQKYTKGIVSKISPGDITLGISESYGGFKWLRFYSSGSYIFDLIATGGILGILTYFGLIIILFAVFVYASREDAERDKRSILFIGYFIGVIIFSQLFLLNNITLIFFEWIFFALLMLEAKIISPQAFPIYSISKEETGERAYLMKFFPLFDTGFIIIAVIIALIGVKAWRYRMADRAYKEFLSLKDNRQSAQRKIDEAVMLNPSFEDYAVASASYSLSAIKEKLDDQKNLDNTKYDAAKSIELVKKNSLNHPFSARAWELKGDVYKTVLPFVKEGASEWILKSYQNAQELEPNNPRLVMELGKAYLLEATKNGVDFTQVDKAIECFNKIMKNCQEKEAFDFSDNEMLCPDDREAAVYLAKALETRGQNAEAIEELNKIDSDNKISHGDDPKVLFELGRLYFNNNNLDRAIEILNSALTLDPNYSNALYTLAAVYEKKEENDKAVLLYKKVAELNPDNKDVQEKIEKLNNSLTHE